MTNSQVPFILVNTYRTHEQLEALASQYPNAIIFYSYTGQETGGLTDSAIWAHGKEYKTGGGDARFRVGTADPADYVTVNSWTPKPGDFYVKEEAIANTSPVQYTRTAYIYAINASNEMVWQVLDGNVTAENVYFPAGFERTEKWGAKTNTYSEPTTDNDTKGLNLKQIFEYYLVKEAWPTIDVSVDTTIPTFSASDGGENSANINIYSGSISNKGTTYSNSALEDEAYVLVNTPLKVVGSYNPAVTLTANFDSGSDNKKTFKLGGKKITGMTYGYYPYDSSTNSWSSTRNTGTFVEGNKTPSIQITYNLAPSGDYSARILRGNTDKGSTVSTLSNNILSPVVTGESATLGSQTYNLVTTNTQKFSRTFKVATVSEGVESYGANNSDSVTIYAISPEIKYSNNKHSDSRELTSGTDGVTSDEITLAYSDQIVDLTPTQTSAFTTPNPSKTIYGYYPIYWAKKGKEVTTATLAQMSESTTKITGTSTSLSLDTSNGEQSGTTSYLVAYPSKHTDNKTFSASVAFGSTALVSGQYVITENAFAITLGDGSTVNYNIISTGGSKSAWASNGTQKFNFTITKNN